MMTRNQFEEWAETHGYQVQMTTWQRKSLQGPLHTVQARVITPRRSVIEIRATDFDTLVAELSVPETSAVGPDQ